MNKPLYLKQFCLEEAQRLGIGETAVHKRIRKGQYRGKIKLEHKSKRTVLVTVL